MDALDLAYVPHPAMSSLSAPSAPDRREKETVGLAAAAVASLALIGAGAVLASPRVTEAPEAAVSGARPFERRESSAIQASALAMPSAPVLAGAEPAPVELRAASPAPILGDLGPEPEPPAAAAVSASPREVHVLTSFDGATTMSDGPVITRAAPSPAPRRAAAPARRSFARAPVVWNRPLNWISTH